MDGSQDHETLNCTFEERVKLVVSLEKEENFMSVQRKRNIYFQFKERVNQPHVTIHPTSVSLKKKGRGSKI